MPSLFSPSLFKVSEAFLVVDWRKALGVISSQDDCRGFSSWKTSNMLLAGLQLSRTWIQDLMKLYSSDNHYTTTSQFGLIFIHSTTLKHLVFKHVQHSLQHLSCWECSPKNMMFFLDWSHSGQKGNLTTGHVFSWYKILKNLGSCCHGNHFIKTCTKH